MDNQPDLWNSHCIGRIPRFSLGRLEFSEMFSAACAAQCVVQALCRHCCGDWLDSEMLANGNALRYRASIISEHQDARSVLFYIVTNADRTVTKVMLPSEY